MVRKSEHCEQWTMFDADSWLCPFGAGKIFAVEKLCMPNASRISARPMAKGCKR
jgi:hypothetical protein